MDLFCDISYKNIACQIKENEYTESNQNKKEIKKEETDTKSSLFEAILSKNDIEYEINDNKKMYIEQIKIDKIYLKHIDPMGQSIYLKNLVYKKRIASHQ